MAEFDERSHEVPNESENDISHPPAESDDNPKQGDGVAGVVTLFFIVGFVGSLVVGWIVFPKLLYSQKHQPINFNHAVHVEMVENSCESCHYFREDGSFSGIPQNAACIECHEKISPGQVKDYRVSLHAQNDVTCSSCHGEEHSTANAGIAVLRTASAGAEADN